MTVKSKSEKSAGPLAHAQTAKKELIESKTAGYQGKFAVHGGTIYDGNILSFNDYGRLS